MDELAAHFDVIVSGTGLTQSIIAAACTRVGKSVFHIDPGDSYGQEWQAYNWDTFQRWLCLNGKQRGQACQPVAGHIDESDEVSSSSIISDIELQEGEQLRRCHPDKVICNVTSISYLCDEEKVKEVREKKNEKDAFQEIGDQVMVDGHDDAVQSMITTSSTSTSTSPEIVSAEDKEESNEWTVQRFARESRKFNLDLCPRLLFARGAMVELLVSSNISRYAEFKAVTRILTLIDDDDKLVDVPISRGDIFNCKDVSVVEKRMLMKFLQFCANFDKNPDQIQELDIEHIPIGQFLTSQNLSPLLQHFILNAIAMVDADCPTSDALKSIQRFINSCGRFGNTPFLFTLYGTGELPQAFCRLCAVFGGVYCLKRKMDQLIVDSENQCSGVIIDGKRINCTFLVTDYVVEPEERSFRRSASQRLAREAVDTQFFQQQQNIKRKSLSRAVLISNSSIKKSETDEISFFRIPKSQDVKSPVWAIEVGKSPLVAPKGIFIVYLWCDSIGENAKLDLLPIVKRLYNFTQDETCEKPKLLWSTYYNQICEPRNSFGNSNPIMDIADQASYPPLPARVFTTSPPSIELDFDCAIAEARSIFHQMYPNEEFLPRAPDPNEIVFNPENGPEGVVPPAAVNAAAMNENNANATHVVNADGNININVDDVEMHDPFVFEDHQHHDLDNHLPPPDGDNDDDDNAMGDFMLQQ